MKYSKFFYLGLNNFIKNKNNKFSCIFIILPLIILISSLSIYKTFSIFIDNDNSNNILHRILFVNSSESNNTMIEKIKVLNNVTQISNSLDFTSGGYIEEFSTSNFTGEIFIYGLRKENLPTIVDGKIDKYESEDSIYLVCPDIIYPDTSISFDKNWKKKTGINTLKYFNQKLSLVRKEDTKKVNVEIIATYSTKENNATQYQCYASPKNNKKINTTFGYEKIQEGFIVVVVDKFTNITNVQIKLNKYGYNSVSIQDDMTYFANNILHTGLYISFIVFFVSFIIIFISSGKNLLKRSKDLYLFRIIGFSSKCSCLIFGFELFLVGIFSWLVSILLSKIFMLLFGMYIHGQSIGNSKIDILFSYESLYISFILAILLPILTFFIQYIMKKGTLIEKIKEEN